MNIGVLKKANEKTPDWLKRLLGPFIRMGLTKNKIFKKQYRELVDAELWDIEQVKSFELNELKKLLIFAYENTKYYKEVFDQCGFKPYTFKNITQIKKIPLLTREILEKRFQDIEVQGITNYYQVTTGGTTGRPIKLLLEKDSIYKERAFVYHFWSKAGYDYKKSKLATFRGIEFQGKMFKYNPLYNEMLFNPFIMNENVIEKYSKKLDEFGATFIYGYPSTIYNFCRLLKKSNIRLKKEIKAVFLISENVYDSQRNLIEGVLNCKTYSFYGHSERAVFAEQKEQGYAFNSMYGYSEIKDGNVGSVICTGFLNRKMPLIRYELDDYAEQLDDHNVYISGHHDQDVLIGLGDERISMASINFHSDVLDNIGAYQFVQNEKGKVWLRIQADKKLKDAELDYIKDAFLAKVNYVLNCKVIQVDSIELTSRGKYKKIIQKLKVNEM